MKKKLVSAIVVAAMAAGLLAGCGSSSAGNSTGSTSTDSSISASTTNSSAQASSGGNSSSEAPYNVRMLFCLPATVPSSDAIQRVQDAMNKLTLKNLNMTVSLEFITFATYQDQLNLALSSNEDYDIFTAVSGYCSSWVSSGYLTDLNDLLDEYGQGILSSYSSEEIAKAPQINGFVFGVPVHKEIAMQPTIFFRTDILDKYNIDVSSVHTIDDVNAIYETLSEKEPDMWMVAPEVGGNPKAFAFDNLCANPTLGVTVGDITTSTDIVDFYETDGFYNWCKWANEWYKKGWINPGIASDTESYYSYIKSGQAFSFFSDYGHPLSEADQEQNCGETDLTMVTLGGPYCTTNTSAVFSYAIPSGSKDPVKAMQMLNYLMTSTDMMNLLNWGEEGVDYVVNEDGLLDYPEGKDASTVGYHLGAGWILPNQFMCTPWSTDGADVYTKVQEYNKTATVSALLGFIFDPTPVTNQVSACLTVNNTYYKALQTGALDPDESLSKVVDELNAAGLQDILAEEQKQVDSFIASK